MWLTAFEHLEMTDLLCLKQLFLKVRKCIVKLLLGTQYLHYNLVQHVL